MFRPGHYGVALAAYAPVGGLLLARGHPTAAVAGGAGVLWLTMLPDWDHRVPFVAHRGPTHTLPFAALVAGGAWAATNAAASATGLAGHAVEPVALPAFAAGIAALAVLAHLAADLLTPMGVALLWPVSDERYSLSVTPADSTLWNYALFALGVFATAVAASLGVELLTGGSP
ncbi:metal-dependent hydrolase [Halorussus caseinilyticus]|uniref:Metal-dependent hydrolase n=1 Tax=Halorussus caseinilyticus TaxID=3034025 RepID=A0ABD5WNN9_9EURY|nr:metal-dependent hydrolase [Halorussus sp. DT72]